MELTFGEKIREARKAKKYTQKQLADKIGAKHNSISDWENNKNRPDPDTIELLCEVLDISPNYLLARSENEFSPAEKLIIKQYRDLDNHGQKMVNAILEKELSRTKQINVLYEYKKLYEELCESRKSNTIEVGFPVGDSDIIVEITNAVHTRTDIDLPTAADTSDDDTMDAKADSRLQNS